MDDNLIPKPEANEGSNEASAEKKSSDERTQDAKENLAPAHRNELMQSPIVPYIKDNCCYIAVKNLLVTNLDTVLMSGDLDYQLPSQWNRNYNSNKFEIVAEDGLPVLQVIYLNPDDVQVNGIFRITPERGLVAFSGFATISLPIEKNDFTDLILSERKPLFKYPSVEHRGELAN